MPYQIIGAHRFYYELAGSGAQTLVFLHGLGSSHRDWSGQVKYFCERYQTLTIDFKGFGYSDKPPGPYSISEFAKDTYHIIATLDLKSVHTIGLSLGGMVALQMAADYPDLIKSSCVVNALPEFVPRTAKAHFDVFLRFALVRLGGMRMIGKLIKGRLFPEDSQAALRAQFEQNWKLNHKASYLAAMRAILNWSILDRVAEIETPVLFISGEFDYTSPAEKEKYLSSFRDASLVVLKGSRHATPLDRSDEFNTHLSQFLNRTCDV